jgi:regulator of sigma E protease
MDIGDLIQMLAQNIWVYGGSLLLVLSVLVFVHEWGHYIIARMCGVKVVTFSIGFGKEIFGFNDKAGTRWKFSMIPLGGYVQLFGDADPASAQHSDEIETDDGEKREMTEEERKVALFTKPLWQRAAVVFAGPAINFIFAVILLSGLFYVKGEPVSLPTVGAVMEGSAAEKYGFMPHDTILKIDGKTISDFSDIRREMLVALDQERHFVVKRGEEIIDINAMPERIQSKDRFGFKSSAGRLGIISVENGILVDAITQVDGVSYEDNEKKINDLKSKLGTSFTVLVGEESDDNMAMIINPSVAGNEALGTEKDFMKESLFLSDDETKAFVHHTLMTAMQSAVNETYVMTRSSIEALWQMVVGVRSTAELGGIVRIGAISGEMAQKGIVPLIMLTALLSINLGFINLLPIPMLDGGHLTFYAIEGILGRPLNEDVQEYAFRAGFVFLILVMAFANLNDVYQLLNLGG